MRNPTTSFYLREQSENYGLSTEEIRAERTGRLFIFAVRGGYYYKSYALGVLAHELDTYQDIAAWLKEKGYQVDEVLIQHM